MFKCYVQNFLGKTLNLVVLDSGCLNKYVEKNGWNVMLKVHVMMIERKYKNWTQTQTLGLGIEKSELLRSVSILSIFCAILLVEMWHMEQNDVVNSEITLLLSKESKRLQILQSFVQAKSKKKIHTLSKIDFANDRIYILGKEILLHFGTSEHYAILLNNINLNLKTSSLEDSKFVEVLLITDNNGEKKWKKKNTLQINYINSLDILRVQG